MSIARRIRVGAAVCLLATAGVVTLTAGSASATVSGCSISTNLSVNRVAFTCYENQTRNWYLRLVCENARGRDFNYNGTLVYGPGEGTSIAQCPVTLEIVDDYTVEL
jgi:hypothetical protein